MLGPFSSVAGSIDLPSAVVAAAKVPNDLLPPRVEDKIGGALGKRFTDVIQERMAADSYEPDRAVFVAVPKPGFTTRPAALLTLADRAVLEALVSAIRPRLLRSFVSPDVCLWPRETPDVAKRWPDFVRSPLVDGVTHVVHADVVSFYDLIPHAELREAIIASSGRRELAVAITAFLDRVMGAPRGLPQGILASDTLATLYLQGVDATMVQQGFQYARHGDDIRVGATSYSDARRAIVVVERALRSVGLTVNSAKCSVLLRTNYEATLAEDKAPLEEMRQRILQTRVAVLGDDPEKLAEALTALNEEELGWQVFYHGNISLEEAVEAIRARLQRARVA